VTWRPCRDGDRVRRRKRRRRAVIEGASVTIGSATSTTGTDGRFELRNVPVGSVSIGTGAPGFVPRSESVGLIAGTNTHDVVLTPAGEWDSGPR
jgi:hypothetical protein